MNPHFNELPIPTAASKESGAIELIRVWAGAGQQHVSLATGLWKDPASWGIMLVDLAKHIANAYGQSSEITAQDALRRLKEGFDAEWNTSTDTPIGTIID